MAEIILNKSRTLADVSSYWDTKLNESEMAELCKNTTLQTLIFGRAKISEEGFSYVKNLPALKIIKIDCKNLRDDWLKHISSLVLLEELNLSYSRVTDSGMKHLRKLQKLKKLDLSCTHIGDGCISRLVALRALEQLNVRSTFISKAGAEKLRVGLPKLKALFI